MKTTIIYYWGNAAFSVVAGAEDAGDVEVVRKQKQSSEKFLHPHHGLHEMLQVHVRHLGRLCASDTIMVLHLKTYGK